MKVIGVIPARYASSRFPGKPLVNIFGKSMIKRVYEQSKKCSQLTDLIVATDDERILNHVINFGGKAMMTSSHHKTGTERCNEVIEKSKINSGVIVNIQGDEPFINPLQIDQVIDLFKNLDTEIGTLAKKIDDFEMVKDTNVVKAIFDDKRNVENFSRTIAEYSTEKDYFKHIGIYGYLTETLAEICKLPPSKNELKESLEQLRWIDNNYQIKVEITTYEGVSIDTPEDIKKIKAQMG